MDPYPSPAPARCIVLLEDDALLRTTLAELLEEQDFTVVQADTRAATLQACGDRDGRCVLIADRLLNTPEECADGHEIATEARQRWPELGVIYTSGAIEAQNRILSERERLLLKPFDLNTLARTVRDLLG